MFLFEFEGLNNVVMLWIGSFSLVFREKLGRLSVKLVLIILGCFFVCWVEGVE